MIVSVIIPIYNGAKYIMSMYRSLKDQTFQDFEVIFINDGSKDDSLRKLKNVAKDDPRVRIFSQENKGICASRNLGLEQAKGKYIIFLDQDDGIENELIEKYVEAINEKNADIASFGKTHYLIDDDKVISIKPQLIDEELVTDRKRLLECLFNIDNKKRLMTIWNCIYRKDIIEEHNVKFDEHFKHGDEDGMFNIEYVLHCQRACFSSKSYYHYYIRKGISTITKYNEELLENYLYYASKVNTLTLDLAQEDRSMVKLYLLRFFSNVYGRFCRFHKDCSDKITFLKKTNDSEGFQFATSLNVFQSRKRLPTIYIYWDFFNLFYLKKKYFLAVTMLDCLIGMKKIR